MRTRSKLILAGLSAALLMSLAVGSAQANRLSVSNKNWRAVWSRLVFTDENENPLVTCPVTMEGSFHSATIRKVLGALIGYVTRATAGRPCTGGAATVRQNSLPWHITYEGFEGALPNITEIFLLLRNVNFTVEVFGIRCGYGKPEDNLNGVAARNTATAEVQLSALPIAQGGFLNKLSGSELLCPGRGGFTQFSGQVTLLGTTTRISITLI